MNLNPTMTISMKRPLLAAVLAIGSLALPAFAQLSKPQSSKVVTQGPIVIPELRHDTGPLLREVAPLLPEFSVNREHEIENNVNPNHNWNNRVQKDAVLQTKQNSSNLQTPNFSLEFDGAGFADNFFCDCMPPDNDGAPGTTQYVQYINGEYQIFDKSGNTELGPLAGNAFWTGFGGSCEEDNSGDPILRFDAAAQRWVVSQFALNDSAPDYECIAVSQTSDATGAYNRYAYPFNYYPDYPKMGVWTDAYYFTFNNFQLSGNDYVGANVCAANRASMLAGTAASLVCFQLDSSQFGILPSDLDGATPPTAGTPNLMMELDPASNAKLDLFKFHVDFTTPANSTFTGPTFIPVAAFTPLCNADYRGQCVPQPTPESDLLESLGDRLMYRLAYRNFGDHTTLLASHSVAPGTGGGVRWYEIRNPESTPALFQSGTFAPDANFRWMPAIAMDKNQDIAIGYTLSGSGSGQYPSLVYAGRMATDPAGTLEAEVVMKAGLGSQTGGNDRWGDYSSLTVDPSDDCTFWFSEEYQPSDGEFNWSTAIGTFRFPGCAGSPDFSLSPSPNSVAVTQGGTATSVVTVAAYSGFSGSVTFSASGLPSGVTAAFNPNPSGASSTLTLTAGATAALGAVIVPIQGVSGSLTHTASLGLTVNPVAGSAVVSLSPASETFPSTVIGAKSAAKTVTLANSGMGTLNIGSITPIGDFALSATSAPCGATLAAGKKCKIGIVFMPSQTGTRTGTLTITDNAAGTPQQVPLSGTGMVQATLTPAAATYSTLKVGAKSGARVFTLANKQSLALSSIAISTSGDFTISATTCGSSLAAKTTCKINVVFSPKAVGVRSGSLKISDSAANSPQTSSLMGTGK